MMINKLREWIDKRWPLSSLVRLVFEEEIPGGASFAYSLGSAVLITFTLLAASGIVQLFFYVPSINHAYDSISYLRTGVPFGWLIHGLHYWGAQVMVVLVLLHVTRVFIWGAYKKPRELTWLAGVTLLLTIMAFIFTGTPLHWDQRGYWTGKMSTGLAGASPFFGDLMKSLLRGGEEMGQPALSRLFGFHTIILPLVLIALFGVHIVAMRRFGAVGPWDNTGSTEKSSFWPDQVFKDTVTGTTIFFILIVLAVFLPPAYTGLADPLDTSYVPKPEWNFLFLHESLKYFHGKLEPVGIVVVPTVLVLMFVLLPFIDRNPERAPLKRPLAMAGALVLAALILTLSLKGYVDPVFGGLPAEQRTESRGLLHSDRSDKSDPNAHPGPQLPGRAAYIIGSVERGATAFAKHCSSCHGVLGKSIIPNRGSLEGKVPDLNPIDRGLYDKDARSFAEKIDRYIQHGSTPAGLGPAIRMPSFGDTNALTQQDISNIEAFILQLNGVDRSRPVNPGMQPRAFFLFAAVLYIFFILILGGIWNKRSGQG